MDTAQIRAHLAFLGEVLAKPNETAADARKAGQLALNLLEDYLLKQHRQVELLEWIATMAQTAENERRNR